MDSTEFIRKLLELEKEFEANYFTGKINEASCDVCIIQVNSDNEPTKIFNITAIKLGPDGNCIVIEGFMA